MAQATDLKLKLLPAAYSVVHLPLTTALTLSVPGPDELWSLTRSSLEYSLVCREDRLTGYESSGSRFDMGWTALYLQGPIPFNTTGVIARLTSPLGKSGIGCFVISTFDSDFILVKQADLAAATAAWHQADISVLGG